MAKARRPQRSSTRAQENARLAVAIQAAHVPTRQTYGPVRLQAESRDDGFSAGVGRITRQRKKLGLRCAQVCRFNTTTNSNHALPVADNRVAHMHASMSRRGNCHDNAPMESFWGTLKDELAQHQRYETREQAHRAITEHIEIFYNRQRRHSRLGNRSPAAFAQPWARQQPAA